MTVEEKWKKDRQAKSLCGIWEKNHIKCPWHSGGDCMGQTLHDDHLNVPINEACGIELCPMIFWAKAFKGE